MSGSHMNTPEGPLLRLYDLISGSKDEERPWDEISSLFLGGARLRIEVEKPDGSLRSGDWSIEEFARQAAESYRRSGFWEREIARRIERFGSISHIWSTYESRIGDPESDPVSRGINSVQLLRRQGRWRIASIIFHMERPGEEIPRKYLASRAQG
jgi:hypothetical protein